MVAARTSAPGAPPSLRLSLRGVRGEKGGSPGRGGGVGGRVRGAGRRGGGSQLAVCWTQGCAPLEAANPGAAGSARPCRSPRHATPLRTLNALLN